MRLQLRAYQQTALDAVRSAFAAGKRAPLLCSPTGSGKTVMFAHITEGAVAKGKRVLILTHRQEIALQTSKALDSLGVQHGIISPQFKHTTDSVQVASVQTLIRRLHKEPAPDIIVVDECSHAVAKSWLKIFAAYPRARLLGTTATPSRLDNRGLGDVFDAMILGPSVKELIAAGHLARPITYAPGMVMEQIQKLKHRGGEFDAAAAGELLDKKTIYGDVLGHFKKICDGRASIAFCPTVAHAEHMAEAFTAAGYKAAAVHGGTEDSLRRKIFADIQNGGLNLVTNCEIAGEGVNLPALYASLLLRPTESTALHIQQCGRAMRPHPGKSQCAILDFVGNIFRHGLAEDDREWTLDGAEQGKVKSDSEKITRLKTCKSCFGANPLWRTDCEQCHAPFEPTREPPKQTDGELVEITEADKERMRVQAKREVGAARTRSELEAIAKDRGYKPQWVSHIMKARGQHA